MKILLVGNYPNDAQHSMRLVASMLEAGLRAAGVDVKVIRPEPLFGRLRRGATGLGKWLGYLDKFLVFPPRLRAAAKGCDLVHICDHSNAFYTRSVRGVPVTSSCHDLLAVRSALGEFPENPTGWSGRILQHMILRGLRSAWRVTCISEATRADLQRVAGRDGCVIYLGLNPVFEGGIKIKSRSKSKSGAGFILHVGGSQWYKNRNGVLDIYAELRRLLGDAAPELVMAGPRGAEAPGVRWVEKLTDAALRELYENAELLLFPSLAEGFGLPVIEAQACGCRVVTTRRAPLTEAGGDAAACLDDPRDAAACARVVADVLAEDETARQRRVQAGLENAARFSMEKMAREFIAFFNGAIASFREAGHAN
jgi:glycosyltransferase involved in cell wall biosynthesis